MNQMNGNHVLDANTNEPIYAVVNMKNKYEHRAKKKLVDDANLDNCIFRRERPNSFHVNSGEYEEVRCTWTRFWWREVENYTEISSNEIKFPISFTFWNW